VPHSTAVPSFAKTSVEQARAQLEGDGFVVRIAKAQYSLEVPAGDVLRVQPGAGTELKEGAVVTLTPSLGPRPIPVPSLQGESVANATQALIDAGFRVARSTEDRSSEQVPKGRVIDTKPAGGLKAPEGSEITLVVSTGPPPRPVPNVISKDVADATGALEAKGFHVTVVRKFSDRIPLDQVISQTPGANVTKPFGTTVMLTVSKGPRSFPVATYIGLSKDAAIAQIEAAGLVAKVSYVPGGVQGKVVGQTPDPGTVVRPGDTITIFVA